MESREKIKKVRLKSARERRRGEQKRMKKEARTTIVKEKRDKRKRLRKIKILKK